MKTILIIEDNRDIRENTAEILELNAYRVVSAENGRAGLTMAKSHLPDLIICDLMMPELDGYQVLEGLKADLSTSSIPFVFVTASVERIAVEQGLNMGASAYIKKPFAADELLQIATDLLNNK